MDTATRIERAVALGLAITGLLALPLLARVVADLSAPDQQALSWRATFNYCMGMLSFALALGLGGWIAWRGPREPAASALALALTLGGAIWVMNLLLILLWVANGYGGLAVNLMAISLTAGIFLSTWALTRFFASFPTPLDAALLVAAGVQARDAARATRIVRMATSGSAALGGALLVAGATAHPRLASLLGTGRADAVLLIVLVMPLAVLGVGLLALERQRRCADADNQRRLRWIWVGAVGGFILFAALGLMAAVVDGPANLMFWLTSAFLVAACFCCVCFAIAVLARGDLSPDLVLRRTLVYSAAGLLVTIGFVALLNLLQEYVLGWLGVPPGAAVYLAGSALAVAFGPLQRRLDAWLATRLPGA